MITDEKLYYKKGYKYQVSRRVSFQLVNVRPDVEILAKWFCLTPGGMLTVEEGYAWDGASGPTIDSKSSMRASLIHDICYQCMRMGLLSEGAKATADEELRVWCVRDGMWSFRAKAWREALRYFATAYLPKFLKKEYSAP